MRFQRNPIHIIIPGLALCVLGSLLSCHHDESKEQKIEIKSPPISQPSNKAEETQSTEVPKSRELTIDEFIEHLAGDPLAKEQWHLFNWGQSCFSQRSGVEGFDLHMTSTILQNIEGVGVRIAISDTGLDVDHEDLIDNIITDQLRNYEQLGPNFLGDPTPSSGSATDAHGTMVAGIIAASNNNGKGGRGIAPKAQIAGFKYLGTTVSKDKMLDQTQGDFDLFNYSYGALQCSISSVSRDQIDALRMGTENLRNGKGAIYLKAAGNEWSGLLSSCNPTLTDADKKYYYGNTNFEALNTLPYLMVVGAIGANGKVASYSTPGANLWVVAPGGEDGLKNPAILTTDLSGCERGAATSKTPEGRFDSNPELNHNCNYSSRMRGSSAATPMVSGVVALMLSVNPELTWREIKHIIATTSDKLSSPPAVHHHPRSNRMPDGFVYQDGWTTNHAGFSYHNWYGFGSINTDRAIEMARNYDAKSSPFRRPLIATTIATTNESVYKQETSQPIPDFDAKGLTVTQEVFHDLIIEGVQLELTITHPSIQDLAVELYSPSGTKSIVINPVNGITDQFFKNELFGTNAFFGEMALGTWKLKIVDAEKNEVTGILQQWGLRIFGHRRIESSANLKSVQQINIVAPPTNSSILESPLFSWETEEEKDFLRYEVALRDGQNRLILPWFSVGKNRTVKLSSTHHRIRFYKKQQYTLYLRKIGMGETESAVTTLNWTAE